MSKTPVPFAPETLETIQRAFRIASDRRHEEVGLEHLLLAITDEPQARRVLTSCGADLDVLRRQLTDVLAKAFTPVAGTDRRRAGADARIRPRHSAGDDARRLVEREARRERKPARVPAPGGRQSRGVLPALAGRRASAPASRAVARIEERACDRPGRRRPGAPSTDPLQAYASDLVARAAAGQIDPLIGRALEIERMVQVLCRRRKNNPLLVGEPGVGKTALAEGLALRIHQGEVPDVLKGARVFALDLGALVAGTRYRGDFEERVKQVLDRLSKEENAILFIDEIHTLVGAGAASGGAMDAGNLLKPALASGQLRCIGSTTFNDVKQSFDRDRALSRRFQKIDVLEPSEDETLEILKGLRLHYESHHGVQYDDEALAAAVSLSARHLQDLHLPDKAIDVIDEAGAAQKMLPAAARAGRIGAAQIEQIVAKMARVPIQTVSSDDKRALERLDVELKQVIFGQDGPIDEVASAIKLSRSGLRAPDKPIGNFLFAGPTGVGKTELARQLARIMGIEFIRFDMSEYMEKHAVSRLIGAPPGYVGYEEGGLLIDAIRKAPHAVLLLDEIEKAHPDMFSILLQVMDHATLTDSHGRKADFRHVVLIMTTNAGARDLSDRRSGSPSRARADRRAARSSGRSRRSSATASTRPSPSARSARPRSRRSSTSRSTRCAAWSRRRRSRSPSIRRRGRGWPARDSIARSARGRWLA